VPADTLPANEDASEPRRREGRAMLLAVAEPSRDALQRSHLWCQVRTANARSL
jgi:hypothetical protein